MPPLTLREWYAIFLEILQLLFILRQGDGTAYIASANYNESLSDPDRVDDLIEMVSTFALIGV